MKWRCGLGLIMEYTLNLTVACSHLLCSCAFLSSFNDMVMYVLT